MPRLLYAGYLSPGQLSLSRCDALREVGAEVETFDFDPLYRRIFGNPLRRLARKLRRSSVMGELNRGLREACRQARPDVVYIDKGADIEASTLRAIRRDAAADGRNVLLLHFHPDHAFHPRELTSAFVGAIAEYDCHLSPHPWVIDEYRRRGAAYCCYLPFGFDPRMHFREYPDPAAWGGLSRDVVFVGSWEAVRGRWIEQLAQSGVRVHVWGPRWTGRGHLAKNVILEDAYADFPTQRLEYARAKICLGMLSETNHDGHTTRTFEIPACGGFMLAERTTGQLAFFEESTEMGCFVGPDELIRKVHYYLGNQEEARAIRERGYRRCVTSGYDYASRMRRVLEEVERLAKSRGRRPA